MEGLLHISELSDEKVENPEDLVNVGDELEVKVLRVDTDERKIGLSRRRVDWTPEEEAKAQKAEAAESGAAGGAGSSNIAAADLKGGLGSAGPLIAPSAAVDAPAEEPAAAEATEEAPAEEPAAEAAAEETAE